MTAMPQLRVRQHTASKYKTTHCFPLACAAHAIRLLQQRAKLYKVAGAEAHADMGATLFNLMQAGLEGSANTSLESAYTTYRQAISAFARDMDQPDVSPSPCSTFILARSARDILCHRKALQYRQTQCVKIILCCIAHAGLHETVTAYLCMLTIEATVWLQL
jgi:hypothetical protein